MGLTVTASDQDNGRAGGAIGYGTGGEVRKTSVTNLNSVTAGKCAGGFAGYFGSGTLANVGGIKLLGLPLLKIDSLLSVGQMIETFTVDSTVSGVSSGYSVSTGNEKGYSGGFIGECISGRAFQKNLYDRALCKPEKSKNAVWKKNRAFKIFPHSSSVSATDR